jgi:non-specific serine/threonine protein kinase
MYVVTQLQLLAGPLLSSAQAALLNSIQVEIDDLYSAYRAKPKLDALLLDIESALESPTPVTERNCFQLHGKVWQIRYGGKDTHLPDSVGLGYIHRLLRSQGREVSAIELQQRVQQPLSDESYVSDLSIRSLDDAGPAYDERARAEFQKELHRLAREREEAEKEGNQARLRELDEETDEIERLLKANTGLGGRSRRLDSPGDKARKAVTVAITRSASEIRNRLPELASHLMACVKTGQRCSYSPDPPVAWAL